MFRHKQADYSLRPQGVDTQCGSDTAVDTSGESDNCPPPLEVYCEAVADKRSDPLYLRLFIDGKVLKGDIPQRVIRC